MDWIKLIKSKKYSFASLILLVTMLLVVLEGISFIVVKSRFLANTEVVNIYNNYIDKVNHIRYIHSYKTVNDSPTDLIFSTIRKYKSNQKNILIQGDSWAELIQNKQSFEVIKTIADKNDYGIINAGTSSYSPSLMRSQLQVLRDDFNIQPKHIVAIFDNTDMGDELCRYKDKQYVDQSGNKYVHAFTKDEQNEIYSLWHFIEHQNIYYSKTFNLIKLFRMSMNSLDYRKGNFDLPESHKTRLDRLSDLPVWEASRINNIINENRFDSPKCGWSDISNPMINGVSSKDHIYLKSIINEYIEKVFDGNVESLYMVTHPHRGHINGEYKFRIKEILEETIFESEFRDKIYLIDFRVSYDLTIFKAKDEASHTTDEYHANVYIPHIFKIIKELSVGI
jgi:hypothetical protein